MARVIIVHVYEEESDSEKLKRVRELERSRKLIQDDPLGTNEQEFTREFGYR